MADFIAIAKRFEDRIDGVEYYETRATTRLKDQLLQILSFESRQLLFLVGRPGSGKSLFLSRLPALLPSYEVYSFNTPFFEPVDFIKRVVERRGVKLEEYSLEEMIQKAMEIYKKSDVIITIDEAQLLSKEMIELIRILADSKAFWFLLAMHEHESQKILHQPQFASRPHRILRIEPLVEDEIAEFIANELAKSGGYSFEKHFSKRLVRYLYKMSGGNFRDLKKILNRMFLLMDCAVKGQKKAYQKPSKCLVTMAAIDGGLLGV